MSLLDLTTSVALIPQGYLTDMSILLLTWFFKYIRAPPSKIFVKLTTKILEEF